MSANLFQSYEPMRFPQQFWVERNITPSTICHQYFAIMMVLQIRAIFMFRKCKENIWYLFQQTTVFIITLIASVLHSAFQIFYIDHKPPWIVENVVTVPSMIVIFLAWIKKLVFCYQKVLYKYFNKVLIL